MDANAGLQVTPRKAHSANAAVAVEDLASDICEAQCLPIATDPLEFEHLMNSFKKRLILALTAEEPSPMDESQISSLVNQITDPVFRVECAQLFEEALVHTTPTEYQTSLKRILENLTAVPQFGTDSRRTDLQRLFETVKDLGSFDDPPDSRRLLELLLHLLLHPRRETCLLDILVGLYPGNQSGECQNCHRPDRALVQSCRGKVCCECMMGSGDANNPRPVEPPGTAVSYSTHSTGDSATFEQRKWATNWLVWFLQCLQQGASNPDFAIDVRTFQAQIRDNFKIRHEGVLDLLSVDILRWLVRNQCPQLPTWLSISREFYEWLDQVAGDFKMQCKHHTWLGLLIKEFEVDAQPELCSPFGRMVHERITRYLQDKIALNNEQPLPLQYPRGSSPVTNPVIGAAMCSFLFSPNVTFPEPFMQRTLNSVNGMRTFTSAIQFVLPEDADAPQAIEDISMKLLAAMNLDVREQEGKQKKQMGRTWHAKQDPSKFEDPKFQQLQSDALESTCKQMEESKQLAIQYQQQLAIQYQQQFEPGGIMVSTNGGNYHEPDGTYTKTVNDWCPAIAATEYATQTKQELNSTFKAWYEQNKDALGKIPAASLLLPVTLQVPQLFLLGTLNESFLQYVLERTAMAIQFYEEWHPPLIYNSRPGRGNELPESKVRTGERVKVTVILMPSRGDEWAQLNDKHKLQSGYAAVKKALAALNRLFKEALKRGLFDPLLTFKLQPTLLQTEDKEKEVKEELTPKLLDLLHSLHPNVEGVEVLRYEYEVYILLLHNALELIYKHMCRRIPVGLPVAKFSDEKDYAKWKKAFVKGGTVYFFREKGEREEDEREVGPEDIHELCYLKVLKAPDMAVLCLLAGSDPLKEDYHTHSPLTEQAYRHAVSIVMRENTPKMMEILRAYMNTPSPVDVLRHLTGVHFNDNCTDEHLQNAFNAYAIRNTCKVWKLMQEAELWWFHQHRKHLNITCTMSHIFWMLFEGRLIDLELLRLVLETQQPTAFTIDKKGECNWRPKGSVTHTCPFVLCLLAIFRKEQVRVPTTHADVVAIIAASQSPDGADETKRLAEDFNDKYFDGTPLRFNAELILQVLVLKEDNSPVTAIHPEHRAMLQEWTVGSTLPPEIECLELKDVITKLATGMQEEEETDRFNRLIESHTTLFIDLLSFTQSKRRDCKSVQNQKGAKASVKETCKSLKQELLGIDANLSIQGDKSTLIARLNRAKNETLLPIDYRGDKRKKKDEPNSTRKRKQKSTDNVSMDFDLLYDPTTEPNQSPPSPSAADFSAVFGVNGSLQGAHPPVDDTDFAAWLDLNSE
jgi:hypothetical protein